MPGPDDRTITDKRQSRIMSLTSLVPAWDEMPPMCEYQGCSRELLADNNHAVPLSDGKWYCKRHSGLLLTPPESAPHPLELSAEDIAAPPPRFSGPKLTLLTDDEWAVLDLLHQAHDRVHGAAPGRPDGSAPSSRPTSATSTTASCVAWPPERIRDAWTDVGRRVWGDRASWARRSARCVIS